MYLFSHLSSGKIATSGKNVPNTLFEAHFTAADLSQSRPYLTAIVNDHTLDIVFDPQSTNNELILIGTVIKHVCSLYFMKGEKSFSNIPVNIKYSVKSHL